MGDSIIGLGALSYLRELFPNSQIVYGVPGWIAPLYEKIEICADSVFGFNLKNLSDHLDFWNYLTNEKFDLIYEMHQNSRTSRILRVFSKLRSTPYYYHNHHLKNGPVLDQGVKKANIQRDLDGIYSMVRKNGLDIPVPSYLNYEPKIKNTQEKSKIVTLGIVATRQTKMWPIENFVEISNALCSLGYKVLIPISGSQLDKTLKLKMIELGISRKTLFIERPLSELPEQLKSSEIYIGNDTGLKHLAVALGMKTLTFFGPEEPIEWHPYDESKHHYFFRPNLECRTRISHFCPLSTCDSMICLNQFTPKQVIDFINQT